MTMVNSGLKGLSGLMRVINHANIKSAYLAKSSPIALKEFKVLNLKRFLVPPVCPGTPPGAASRRLAPFFSLEAAPLTFCHSFRHEPLVTYVTFMSITSCVLCRGRCEGTVIMGSGWG